MKRCSRTSAFSVAILLAVSQSFGCRQDDQSPNGTSPPSSCLSGVPCVDTTDCVSVPGTRCNTALAEPECQTIRCGHEGSVCSEDALCPTDMSCFHEICGTCDSVPFGATCIDGEVVCLSERETLCNGSCVDVMTSPSHCGECNRRVPDQMICVDGLPNCEDSRLQPCGDECVNLMTDPDHCGACDTPAAHGYCVNGNPDSGCPPFEQLCDDACIGEWEIENCGGCGLSCEYLRETDCSHLEVDGCDVDEIDCVGYEGGCSMWVLGVAYYYTCNSVCTALGGECIGAERDDWSTAHQSCDETHSEYCECLFEPRTT